MWDGLLRLEVTGSSQWLPLLPHPTFHHSAQAGTLENVQWRNLPGQGETSESASIFCFCLPHRELTRGPRAQQALRQTC